MWVSIIEQINHQAMAARLGLLEMLHVRCQVLTSNVFPSCCCTGELVWNPHTAWEMFALSPPFAETKSQHRPLCSCIRLERKLTDLTTHSNVRITFQAETSLLSELQNLTVRHTSSPELCSLSHKCDFF